MWTVAGECPLTWSYGFGAGGSGDSLHAEIIRPVLPNVEFTDKPSLVQTHTHTNTRTSVWERSGVKQTQMRLLLQVFRQVLLHHLQKERSQYLTMTETVNGYTSAPWTEKNCSLQRSIQLKHILEHAQKDYKHSEGNIRWDRLWGHISSPRLPLCWSETVEEEHNNKL